TPRNIALRIDRLTLAKRRWRATAEDGADFGFDLDTPLRHGQCFFADGPTRYHIHQTEEPVLEVDVTDLDDAMRLAWSIGNLHQAMQPLPSAIRMPDDPALHALLQSLGRPPRQTIARFEPLRATAHHHHHHH
ncbi:MAG TPA: urease accessory protein UreE, partial [Kiritimatiellia bacterium]|nr:urease accessory protein UreE [Kiritimatiellia bacterium]